MLKKRYAALMIVISLIGSATMLSFALSPDAETMITPVNDTVGVQNDQLTSAEAEDIALGTVGLSRDDVILKPTEADREKGKLVWEVEIYHGSTEYDLEIDAYTGDILKQEKEVENKPAENPDPQPATIPEVVSPAPTELTKEKALEIVLADAGLTADKITRLKVEKDYDDGATEYEIEFYVDSTEYDYTVDAVTGKILGREVDHKQASVKPQTDPVPTPEVQPVPASPEVSELTKEKALEIALADAGLSADEVHIKVEKDRDDGVWVYEIEFNKGRMEYDYEIRVSDGKILERDVERD